MNLLAGAPNAYFGLTLEIIVFRLILLELGRVEEFNQWKHAKIT